MDPTNASVTDPKPSTPLGIPEGSVRAIIVIMVVAGYIGSIFVLGAATASLETVLALVIGYYFGSRP